MFDVMGIKQTNKRGVFAAVLVLLLCLHSKAVAIAMQTPDKAEDVRLLREAKTSFRANQFGKALEYAERAKYERKKIIKWQYNTVNSSLKAGEVKKARGILTDIIPILQEREEQDAIDIILLYQRKLPASYLKDSADNLVDFLSKSDAYPEADMLIGKVYRLEGEYSLSRQYLLSAWQNARLLDIQDEQYSILYELAELCFLEGDMDGYEKNLLLILKDSGDFNNAALKSALLSRIRGGKKEDMEKFFLLFRCDNYRSIKAYGSLADYYQEVGEKDKALVLSALGVLTGFSKLYDTVRSRDPEFEYKGLQSLFDKMEEYSDIIDWAEEERIWHLLNEFAMRVNSAGSTRFATDLLTTLAKSATEDYWRRQAAEFLATIKGGKGATLSTDSL